MTDLYASHMSGLESPAYDAFVITPTNAVALATVTRAIYVGTGGDIALTMKSGSAVTLKSVPSGSIVPVRATEVAATGTTASNLVGLA